MPADRVAALREALAKAMDDPGLKVDAERANLQLVFTPGEEVGRIVREMFDIDPEVKARLKEILK